MTPNVRRSPLGWLACRPGARRPVLGMAVGPPSAADPPDPLEVPRAVRRALADAGRKATEVGRLVCTERVAGPDARALARTALGPTGERVALDVVPPDEVPRSALPATEDIVVTVDAPGRTPLAMCLGPRSERSAGQSDADPDAAARDE